jgi:hypothetical protein
MSEWQPIETAPKGQLLFYQPACYSKRDGTMTHTPLMRVGLLGDWPARPPTHWTPLPPLPEGSRNEC